MYCAMVRSVSDRRWLGAFVALLLIGPIGAVAAPQASAVGPVTRYVAATGSPGDGTSCASPGYVGSTHTAIQAAVTASARGDTVHICEGVYQVGTTIDVDREVTLQGAGPATSVLDGGGNVRILTTTNGDNSAPALFRVTLSALQFRNGFVTGGDIRGGAIENSRNVALVVEDSLFRNNVSASDHGGAISVGIYEAGGEGSGYLSIARSTFVGNRAGADGGAISDTRFASAQSTVVNSTFVGNHAGRAGGAIDGGNGDSGTFLVLNSTFLDNTSGDEGSAVAGVTVKGSLLASPPHDARSLCRAGHVTSVTNAATSAVCLDPASTLTPVTYDSLGMSFLALWGGSTPTVAFAATSSARNAVPANVCEATDQRGVIRAVGDTLCDAGAFEYVAGDPAVSPLRSTIATVRDQPMTPTSLTASVLTNPTFRVVTELGYVLPDGITLSTSGTISGTPTATASSTTAVIAAEQGGQAASSVVHVTVAPCGLVVVSGAYLVGTAGQLSQVADCPRDATYRQTADITWNGAWTGIGTSNDPFTGNYQGDGHSITGLQIQGDYAGFISHATNATVSALTLTDVVVDGGQRSGAVVGYGTGTTLNDVHARGTVSAQTGRCIGGLVGTLDNGSVSASSFEGSVEGAEEAVGGLVGCADTANLLGLRFQGDVVGYYQVSAALGVGDNTNVVDVHAQGTVTTIDITDNGCAGGVVGESFSGLVVRRSSFTGTVSSPTGNWNSGLVACVAYGSVEQSVFRGEVIGNESIGGLVGWMTESDLRDSWVIGSVTGQQRVSGLVGEVVQLYGLTVPSNIVRNFGRVTLSAVAAKGGLLGEVNSASLVTVSASFWQSGLPGADDIDSVGHFTGAPVVATTSATPLVDLMSHSFFDQAGWSIVDGWESSATSANVWGICDGESTPFLLWEYTTSPCSSSSDTSSAPTIPPPTPAPTTTGVSSPLNATTTATTAPTITTVPTTTAPASTGPVSSLTPGALVATVNGARVDGALTWVDDTTVVGSLGDMRVRLRFVEAGGRSPRRGSVAPGTQVMIELDGVHDDTEVSVTLFSSPRHLGTYRVEQGSVIQIVTLPSDVEPGAHQLQLIAVDASGRSISMWLGISVDASLVQLPATGSGGLPVGVPALAMLVVGIMLLVAMSRRVGVDRRSGTLLRD
jgi:hypothetical protein